MARDAMIGTLPALGSFAHRLSWGMRQAGVKNPDVAAAAGTNAETVSRWRGGATPDPTRYEPIAALLRAHDVPATAEWLRTGVAPSQSWPGVDRTKEERAWLARFRAELIDADASDAVVDAAEQLARSLEVRLFYHAATADENPVGPLVWIGDAIRQLTAAALIGPAEGTTEARRRRQAKRRPEPTGAAGEAEEERKVVGISRAAPAAATAATRRSGKRDDA